MLWAFKVIDVTNAGSPALLSTLGYSAMCSSGDGGDGVAVSGDGKRAYVGTGTMFRVFDVSNLAQPYMIGNLNLAGNARAVALSSDEAKAYIATDAGLQIIKLQ